MASDTSTAALGTIDPTKKGIPPEIKAVTDREKRSYQVYWNKQQREMSLNSYVAPTKSNGKRNVLNSKYILPNIRNNQR